MSRACSQMSKWLLGALHLIGIRLTGLGFDSYLINVSAVALISYSEEVRSKVYRAISMEFMSEPARGAR
jgi:hypothetical protein